MQGPKIVPIQMRTPEGWTSHRLGDFQTVVRAGQNDYKFFVCYPPATPQNRVLRLKEAHSKAFHTFRTSESLIFVVDGPGRQAILYTPKIGFELW